MSATRGLGTQRHNKMPLFPIGKPIPASRQMWPSVMILWMVLVGFAKGFSVSSKKSIVIAPAQLPQELEAIQACRATAFDRPVSRLMESQQIFVNATTVARGRATCWVAKTGDGSVWGTADVSAKANDRRLTLCNVYVKPDARGQGLAKQLLAAVEEDTRSQGRPGLALEVYTGNTPAYTLYQRSDFETKGIHAFMAKLAELTGFSFLVRMEKDL